jgi:acyl dehydratase
MALNRELVGREYPAPGTFEVSREMIRRFAEAIGDTNPAYVDPSAAKDLGHDDIVAPPTFLTVLGFRFGLDGPVADPELNLDYSLVVHGEQRFVHHRPVKPGDVLAVTTSITDIRDAGRNELMTTKAAVTTTDGEPVSDLYSTLVSRGTAAAKEG